MRNQDSFTLRRAVFRGHLIATLPALLLLLATFALFARWIAQPLYYPIPSLHAYFERLGIVSVAALLVGWLWWSIAILRWRLWMKSRGMGEKEIQHLGERTLLLWPKGILFEKLSR